MTARRTFIAAALAVLAAPLAAQEKPPARVYRVGVLEASPLAANTENIEQLRKGLRDAGYVEGKNLALEYRSADGHLKRYRRLAAELVNLPVDVIVTRGTPASMAAKNAAGNTPVVTTMVVDPVETGLVASLTRPGGKVTGLAVLDTEVEGKRIELLKAIAPKTTHIAAFINMANPALAASWQLTHAAARNFGLEAQLIDVRTREDLEGAFQSAVSRGANAAVVRTGGVTPEDRRAVAELALKHKMPAMYVSRQFVDAGGLVSYGVNISDLYYRAGKYVDRVLKGTNPGELAMDTPTKFELVINRRTVRALDLVVPPDILLRSTATVP
jgi:putative tryptophan/tyrosine transport system substrate-binding protein